MISLKKCVWLVVGVSFFSLLPAQQVPTKPASYPVFSPLILNPAIAGSHDFTGINLTSRVNGSHGAQMASYHSRLPQLGLTDQSAAEHPYSRIGLGGYLFHDRLPDFRNIGTGISAAYHLSPGNDKYSNLSFGLSVKGRYNRIIDEDESVGEPAGSFTTNADVGVYYQNSRGFIGVSSVNLFSLFSDSLVVADNHLPSEHLFYGGIKIVLSRKNQVLFEPSLLFSINEPLLSDSGSNVVPYLKFYMQNAWFGTYFKKLDNLAFFLQYQFPRFYAGMCIEYPLKEMLITGDQLFVELTLGLNLGKNRQLAHELRIPPPLFGIEEELTGQEKADTGRLKKKSTREEQAEVREEMVETEEKLTVNEEELVEVKQDLKETREELAEIIKETEEKKIAEPVVAPATEAQPAKVEEDEPKKDVVIFRVQFSSSTRSKGEKPVVIDGKSYEPFEYFYLGAYRQCIGNFRDLDEANALKNRCRAAGYNQAFVAAFINDERVTDPAVFRR